MPVEPSDVSCPDCGRQLQVIYATELRQVVSGYACPDCEFAVSQKAGLASVSLTKPREYLLRIEKPLSTDDVRDAAADVREEFRVRASESMAEDELWLLIDREENTVIDLLAGDSKIPPLLPWRVPVVRSGVTVPTVVRLGVTTPGMSRPETTPTVIRRGVMTPRVIPSGTTRTTRVPIPTQITTNDSESSRLGSQRPTDFV